MKKSLSDNRLMNAIKESTRNPWLKSLSILGGLMLSSGILHSQGKEDKCVTITGMMSDGGGATFDGKTLKFFLLFDDSEAYHFPVQSNKKYSLNLSGDIQPEDTDPPSGGGGGGGGGMLLMCHCSEDGKVCETLDDPNEVCSNPDCGCYMYYGVPNWDDEPEGGGEGYDNVTINLSACGTIIIDGEKVNSISLGSDVFGKWSSDTNYNIYFTNCGEKSCSSLGQSSFGMNGCGCDPCEEVESNGGGSGGGSGGGGSGGGGSGGGGSGGGGSGGGGSGGGGSGGGGSGGGGSGGGGSATTPNPTGDYTANIGSDINGDPMGSITWSQPLDNLSVNRLQFSFNQAFGENAEVISDAGGIRQIKAHEGLIVLVDGPNNSVEIHFYEASQVGAKGSNGDYILTGDPFKIEKFVPEAHASMGSGIAFTQIENSESTTKQYFASTSGNGSMTRSVDEEGRITDVITLITVDPTDSSKWIREVTTENYEVINQAEVLISSSKEEFASRGHGELLDRSIEDPNGANLITEYAYYENPSETHQFKKKKHVIYPNGSWEKCFYDAQGQLQKTIRPWKDYPAHPDQALHGNAAGVHEFYSYLNGKTSFTRTQIQGKTTQSTSYLIDADDSEGQVPLYSTITRRAHGDVVTSPKVLEDKSSYLIDQYSTISQPRNLYRSLSSSGEATRYSQAKGTFNESTGVFTVNPDGAFTRSVSTQGTLSALQGLANKTTRTVTISDYKGIRRQETQVYTGSGFETVGVTTYQYETGVGTRLLSTKEDGIIVSNTQYTSATHTSQTDAHGITTTSVLDKTGRLIQSIKEGIAASGSYDAQAPVVTNYSEQGFTSTTTVTAGTLSYTTSSTRDITGRTISETDEQGRVTTYIYANGGRSSTQILPGNVRRESTYYLDGQLKSITLNDVLQEVHDYTLDADGNIVHTTYHGSQGLNAARWTKTVTNGLGQVISEIQPNASGSNLVTTHEYNDKGQRIKTTRTGQATALYIYDELGQVIAQGADLNGNHQLDKASAEPITETEQYYEKDASNQWWQVSSSRKYLVDGSEQEVALSLQKRKLGTGSSSVSQRLGPDNTLTTYSTTVDRANKLVTSTTTSSLSNLSAVQITRNGLLVSQSSLTVSSPVLLRYDGLGRQTHQIDPRTNKSTLTVYNTVGQISSVSDGLAHTTTYTYYPNTHPNAGMLASQTNAEGEITRYHYDAQGRLLYQWGSAIYPQAYTFDELGQMNSLKTYQSTGDWNLSTLPTSFASATASLTTWNYHPASGQLLAKTDAKNKATTYSYNAAGQMASRTWARGASTDYTYDSLGRLTSVNYSDSTPEVNHRYRRDGQRVSTHDAAGHHTYTYHQNTALPASETIEGGLLQGVEINRSIDEFKRPNGFTAHWNHTPLQSTSYSYDARGRMAFVSNGKQSATYGYTNHSDLISSTTLKTGTHLHLSNTKSYDDANRLTSTIWQKPDSTVVSSHAYTYDAANRRLRATMADGSYWDYTYNDKGEVVSGVKKNAANTIYPGLNHSYAFDEIGNRLTASVDAESSGSRTTAYTANSLNQYSSIGTASAFDVTGSAVETAIVKVNHQTAQRLGPYFRKEVPVSNSSSGVWSGVNIEVTLPGAGVGGGDIVTTRNGHRYMAPSPETLSYDDDGNLVSDSRWTYSWDAENRLIAMETNAIALSAGVPKRKLAFAYDGQSRRISKKVMDWSAANNDWSLTLERRFVYDGWNLVAEVDGSGNLVKSHTWGLDLSQSQQGAGGVGGLLWTHDVASSQTHFMAYDGNGNVTALVKADSSNTISARYDYNAFGETVLQEGEGTLVSNPYRFSTKYQDEETGVCYYGYRYYIPEHGRFINRDPIGERGGLNLYGMVANDPVNKWDYLGWKPGKHLTKAEAESLHCALVWYLNSVTVRAGALYVGYRWAPTMLRNYIAKDGDTTMPYSAISRDDFTKRANDRAIVDIRQGGKSSLDVDGTFVDPDLTQSLGGVWIYYTKGPGGNINAKIRDYYTFSANRPVEKRSPGRGASLPGLSAMSKMFFCCWDTDDIKDEWLADLEKYGLAKSFYITIEWTLWDMSSWTPSPTDSTWPMW